MFKLHECKNVTKLWSIFYLHQGTIDDDNTSWKILKFSDILLTLTAKGNIIKFVNKIIVSSLHMKVICFVSVVPTNERVQRLGRVLRAREDSVGIKGQSEVSCVCSKIYDPVCGYDAHSYYNTCQFECTHGKNGRIKIKHQGNCIPF